MKDIEKDILQMLADGTRVQVIADVLGCSTTEIHRAKVKYPDFLKQLQGRNLDGVPIPEQKPEAPPEEPDIMADIEKACRLIISKSIEALEKSAGCIQIEAAANAVSTVHNVLVTHQAKKELRETMNKRLETRKPSECPSFGIGTIPNFKL